MDNQGYVAYRGRGAVIRYAPSIDGPERCMVALGQGYDAPSWPLPAVTEVIGRLKDGRSVIVADTKAATPGLADWLIANDFVMPIHRTIGPLPRHLGMLGALYADLRHVGGELAAQERVPGKAAGRYVAVIRAGAVRDVQYDAGVDSDPESDEWTDMPGAEVFLGMFEGSEDDARLEAARYGGTDPANVRLMPV